MSTISCANQGHCSKGLDALRDNQRVQGCAPWWTYPFLVLREIVNRPAIGAGLVFWG